MDRYDALDVLDVVRIARRLPPRLADMLKADSRLFVAGGFIRSVIAGERVSDIDVFGPTATVAREKARQYAAETKVQAPHETDNALTVRGRPPVQFIHRWEFTDPVMLMESFDFTIAAAAIWWGPGRWASIIDGRFYRDLAAHRLVFRGPPDNTSGGSLLRLQKFARRGYHASAAQVARIAVKLATAAGADPGVEAQMTRLVREVDPRSPEWDDEPEAPSDTVGVAASVDDDEPVF